MTIKEVLRELSKERYDKKNMEVFIRKYDVGCWHIKGFSNEDSGFYLDAGEDTNPQPNGGEVVIDADRSDT